LSEQSKALYQELKKESDRGAALIGAAFLDDALETLLRNSFVEKLQVAERLLIDPRGALGTFSARTDLAYCLGLIGPKMYHDLNTLRVIRNSFGHTHRSMSLEDPGIKDQLATLKYLAWLPSRGGLQGRDRFVLTVVILTTDLLLVAERAKHPEKGEDFPLPPDTVVP
jgi:DNA-binding MltR family transcriptional regulator